MSYSDSYHVLHESTGEKQESKRMIAMNRYLILNYVTIWHEDDHVIDLFGS